MITVRLQPGSKGQNCGIDKSSRAMSALFVLLIALSFAVLGLRRVTSALASEYALTTPTISTLQVTSPRKFTSNYHASSTGASATIGRSSLPTNSANQIPADEAAQTASKSFLTAWPLWGDAPMRIGFSLRDYQYHASQVFIADFGDGAVQSMAFVAVGCSDGTEGCYNLWSIEHTYSIPGVYTVTVYRNGPNRVVATTSVSVTGQR
jgi:hypothetical protein